MDDSALIKTFESSWTKRLLIIGAALVVATLIGFVVWGFHGRDIASNAAALTPVTAPAH